MTAAIDEVYSPAPKRKRDDELDTSGSGTGWTKAEELGPQSQKVQKGQGGVAIGKTTTYGAP